MRSEHEFCAGLCDALAGISAVLAAGSKTGIADFKRYVEKHRATIGRQIIGWESIERPTEDQLVGMARPYFLKYDRMAGTPTPG